MTDMKSKEEILREWFKDRGFSDKIKVEEIQDFEEFTCLTKDLRKLIDLALAKLSDAENNLDGTKTQKSLSGERVFENRSSSPSETSGCEWFDEKKCCRDEEWSKYLVGQGKIKCSNCGKVLKSGNAWFEGSADA